MSHKNDVKQPSADSHRQHASKRLRLLLVDDEKGFADVLAKRMTRRNIAVTTAYSGIEAIQSLRRSDFDVVILDLKMEDMDGLETLKTMKKMDPDIKVVMLTGHGCEMAARDGLEQGAVDYLCKPCDFDELLDRVRAIFQGEKK
jgi:DNA-binding response OmpR family regulator